MAGPFDDLIPAGGGAAVVDAPAPAAGGGNPFADLIPKADAGGSNNPFADLVPQTATPEQAQQLGDTAKFILDRTTGPGSLVFDNALMNLPEPYDPMAPGNQPQITPGKPQGLQETIRRALSPLLGPTPSQQTEGAIAFGKKDAQGNPIYEYKPLAGRPEKEGLLTASYLGAQPLPANPADSTLKATGKAILNQGIGLENALLSPLGVATAGLGSEFPVAGRVISGAFAADMAAHVPGQLDQLANGKTLQDRIEGGLGAVVSLLTAGTAGTHALAGEHPSLDTVISQTRAELDKAIPPSAPLTKEPFHISDQTLDGLVKTRQAVVDGMVKGKVSSETGQPFLDRIDNTLLKVDNAQVKASEERVAARQAQTQLVEGEVPPVMPEGPLVQGGRSSLFTRAKEEAGAPPEATPTEELTSPITEPVTPSDRTSPEYQKAATTLSRFQGIAEAAAKADGATDEGLAVSEAIHGAETNPDGGLAARMTRSELSSAQAKAALVDAAQKAAGKQLDASKALKRGGGNVGSLDAETETGKTVGESVPSEAKTPAEVAAKSDAVKEINDRLSGIKDEKIKKTAQAWLEAERNNENPSLRSIGEKLGISHQAVADHLKALRSHFEDLQDEGYSMGPGAASIFEKLGAPELIGITNETVNSRRAREGNLRLMDEERKANPETWRKVEDKLYVDPTYGSRLVDRIRRGDQSSVNDEDQAALIHEMVTVKNARDQEAVRAADRDSTEAERAAAQEKYQQLDDRLNEVDQATKLAGVSAGRALQIRKMQIRDDYSYAGLARKKAKAVGRDLTPEEKAPLKEEAAQVEKAQKEADEVERKFEDSKLDSETNHFVEATINELGKAYLEKPTYGKKVFDIARGIVDRWKDEAKVASEELRRQLGSEEGALGGTGGKRRYIGQPKPENKSNIVANVAKILRAKIGEFGLDKTEAFAEVVTEYGEKVRPHLEPAWRTAKNLISGEKGDTKAKEVASKGVSRKGEKTPVEAKAEAKAEKVAGDKLSQKVIVDHVRALINAGEHDPNTLMRMTHEAMVEHFPDVTERDVRRAFVKYGEKTFPSKDAVETEIRESKQIVKIQEDIDREVERSKGVIDPKTGELIGAEKQGYQRDKASQRVRDLIKQRNELLKKREGPQLPEKLASEQTRRRTALENAIADTDRELKTGKKRAKTEAAPDDAHNEQLRAELQAMRNKVKEIDAEQNPGKSEAQKQEDELQKQLENLNAEMAGKKAKATPTEWKALSQKAEDLRAQLDSVRQLKKELEAKPGKTLDGIAREKAQKGVDAAAAAMDRWDRILKGEIDRDPAKVREPQSQLEEDLRSEVDAMRNAADQIRRDSKKGDPNFTKEQQQLKAIEKSITEYERRTKNLDFSTKGKNLGPDTEKISNAKAARDAAKKVYDDLKKAQKPARTAEQKYNDTRLKQLEKRTKELEALRKSGRNSYAKMGPSKAPVTKYPEVRAAEAKVEKLKQDIDAKFEKDRLSNRTPSQKFWDHFVGVQRAMKLSSDVVIGKLSVAAAVRELGLTPAEEVVSGAYSGAENVIRSVLRGKYKTLSEMAPREGGINLRAEAKAKAAVFTSGMKDAWENLKMSKSELETLYGDKRPNFPSWYEYLGYLHGALKAPIKRAEFERSLEKRIYRAKQNGENTDSTEVMGRLSEEAYVDAQRSIFMQDNAISNIFNNALSMAERNKDFPTAGPAIARIGRFLVPIVKVPTNIVGEVATGIHGLGTGAVRAGAAYIKGVESLKPEQADSILRQIKKGAIGNALLLTGYFGYQGIGGFFQKNDKRDKNDVQPGHFRIGKFDLPEFVGHSSAAMLLDLGATFRWADEKGLTKGGAAGALKGASAAGRGLVKQLPFVPAVSNIAEALDSDEGLHKYVRDMAIGSIVPSVLPHVAKIMDTPGSYPKNAFQPATRRFPKTDMERLKEKIPVLRSQLPSVHQKPQRIPYKQKGR